MEEKTTTGRRKFLVKASAGALISTIPAKSVWATGLTNSIVASGHGSDMGGRTQTNLQPVSFWQTYPNYVGTIGNEVFYMLFGGYPFEDDGSRPVSSLTLIEILTAKDQHTGAYLHAGPGNVNWNMIAVVLNAHKHTMHGIHYPILGADKPFQTTQQLAMHINTKFSGSAAYYGAQLQNVLDHHG